MVSLIVVLFLYFGNSLIVPSQNLTGSCDEPGCYRPAGLSSTVHHYTFTVTRQVIPGTNETKPSIVVNGMLPGPTIEVNESDIVIVDLYNELGDVPVVLHWHGLFQVGTSFNDGVPYVSQCVDASRNVFRYTFVAEPAGTTWWHGHHDTQYTDGLFGPLIIHRRGGDVYQENYVNEWIWQVNDWYDYPATVLRDEYFLTAANPDGVEPEPDAIMVNGKFTNDLVFSGVDPTKRVLVRVINSAAFSMYNISVNNIPLHIVAIDGTDISPPLIVPWVIVNVAQRVDIILDLPNYPLSGVTSTQFHFDACLEMYPVDILNYTQPTPPYPPNTKCRFNPNWIGTIAFTSPTGSPSESLPSPTPRVCSDEDINYLDARPLDFVHLPPATHSINMTISFQNLTTSYQLAFLNNVTFPLGTIGSQYGMPELYAFVLQSLNGTASQVALNASGPGPSLHNDESLRFYIPDNAVVDVFVENTDGGDHPFHLHGHNFHIIATSDCPNAGQAFSGGYLRRDTVSIPAADDDGGNGWVLFRVVANNPGAWMFHCHIDWHMEAGLGCLFMESPSKVFRNQPPPDHRQFCQPRTVIREQSVSKTLTKSEIGLIAAVVVLFVLLVGTCLVCLLYHKKNKATRTHSEQLVGQNKQNKSRAEEVWDDKK